VTERPDAAAYVLGQLSPEADRRARDRERDDPAFAAEVRRLRAVAERVGALGPSEWTPPEPPPLRLDPSPPARRRRLVLRPAVAAVAVIVLLAAGAAGGALLAGGGGTRGEPATVARLAPVGSGPQGARAEARVGADRVTLTVSGLEPTAGGDYYELWMLRSPTELVALGSFRVDADGRARVTLPLAVDPRRFPVLDVSLEPADGDPAHSQVSVLRSPPLRS
jgi:anti-sigma-K factor RskA